MAKDKEVQALKKLATLRLEHENQTEDPWPRKERDQVKNQLFARKKTNSLLQLNKTEAAAQGSSEQVEFYKISSPTIYKSYRESLEQYAEWV